MVRHDYACKRCEKTFVLWSDDGRVCPHCASRRVFKVILTPIATSTGNAAKLDKLAEKQIEAAGLSNYSNAGGTIRRTRKTDPKLLEAVAAAKAANIPIQTGANGRIQSTAASPVRVQNPIAQQIAARGKGHVTTNPKGPGAVVNQLMQTGRRAFNLNHLTQERRYPTDGGKADVAKLASLLRK